MGRLNNAALVDRMMGWMELAKGGAVARGRAIQHFARGLWRAVTCNDPSIRGKIAANLVRAVYSTRVAELDFNRVVDGLPASLPEACRALAEGSDALLQRSQGPVSKESALGSVLGVFVDYLIYLYRDRGSDLKAEMLRFSNLKRFPIYLPLEPPNSG